MSSDESDSSEAELHSVGGSDTEKYVPIIQMLWFKEQNLKIWLNKNYYCFVLDLLQKRLLPLTVIQMMILK